jgi:hypothetical protein
MLLFGGLALWWACPFAADAQGTSGNGSGSSGIGLIGALPPGQGGTPPGKALGLLKQPGSGASIQVSSPVALAASSLTGTSGGIAAVSSLVATSSVGGSSAISASTPFSPYAALSVLNASPGIANATLVMGPNTVDALLAGSAVSGQSFGLTGLNAVTAGASAAALVSPGTTGRQLSLAGTLAGWDIPQSKPPLLPITCPSTRAVLLEALFGTGCSSTANSTDTSIDDSATGPRRRRLDRQDEPVLSTPSILKLSPTTVDMSLRFGADINQPVQITLAEPILPIRAEPGLLPVQYLEPCPEAPERNREAESKGNALVNMLGHAFDWLWCPEDSLACDFSRLDNGNQITTLSNGASITELAEGARISRLPNGSQINLLATGLRITRLPDGTTVTELKNRLKIFGSKYAIPTGGVRITQQVNSVIVDLADGSRLVMSGDLVSRRENPLGLSFASKQLNFNLPKGDCLFEPGHKSSVQTADGPMHVAEKSVLFTRSTSSLLMICNLYDPHAGSVRLNAYGLNLSLPPGRALVISRGKNAHPVVPFSDIATRNWQLLSARGACRVFSCEFSIPSTVHTVSLLKQVVTSKLPRDRDLKERLMKMSVALNQACKQSQPYSFKSDLNTSSGLEI